MPAKNFRELRDRLPEDVRVENQRKARRLIDEMSLDQLRAARSLTQENLSSVLGVNQSAISKLERRADMYISTLRSYIEAMGGQLEIRAVFDSGPVRITQFSELEAREKE